MNGRIATIGRNAVSLLAGDVFNKASTFCVYFMLGRYAGKHGFGQISYGLALLYLFNVFAAAGLHVSITREVAKHKDKSKYYLYNGALAAIASSTIAVLVMGVRMLSKYQHNKYQKIRTVSVMFFQTAFAFLIPEILVRMNQPWFDFKNMWPLDYDFFYSYNVNDLMNGGNLGMFMLVWGIALIIVAVPISILSTS